MFLLWGTSNVYPQHMFSWWNKKNINTHFPFIICLKAVFRLAFYSNENVLFWLTILYQELFVFSVSSLCFQIFPVKSILQPKMDLTFAISIVNWIFGNNLLEIIFCASLLILNYWCSITMLWIFQNFEQVERVKNLHRNYLPSWFLPNLQPFLLWEKWNFSIKTIA